LGIPLVVLLAFVEVVIVVALLVIVALREVVDEGALEVLPRVDGVWFKAFKPSEGHGFQGYREVESLGGIGSP
jgi:hypothetical protein